MKNWHYKTELKKNRKEIDDKVRVNNPQLYPFEKNRPIRESTADQPEFKMADILYYHPNPTLAIDLNGRVIVWNQAMEGITDVPASKMIGYDNYKYSKVFYGVRKPILIDYILHKDQELYDKLNEHYQHLAIIGERAMGERNYINDGKRTYYLCIASPIYNEKGELIGAIESVRDITERRETEEALAESEERYRRIVETANEGIWITDAQGFTTFANRKMADMLGCCQESLIGTSIIDYIASHWLQVALRHEMNHSAGVSEQYEIEFLRTGKDTFWALVSVTPLIDRNGKYTGALRMIADISQLKQAVEDLRLSQEKFAKAFNSSPSLMAITVGDGKIIESNNNFSRITGYSRNEIIGERMEQLIFAPDIEQQKRFREMILANKPVQNLEMKYYTKYGQERVGLLSVDTIDLNDGKYRLNTITDVTDYNHMLHEVARLDQLNLVGKIAASIGHETRNPMTTVRGFLQIIKDKEKYQEDAEYFEIMIEELDRANTILTEFLSLAKDKSVDLKLQDLNTIITGIVPLIKADAIAQEKYLKTTLGDIPLLLLDQKEIRQLIFNFVRNGFEAMDSGGTLTIGTFVKGDDVVLMVKDEGSGIDPELLRNIGTPFFSTKDQGTGLGLSICYSIAARHKATIDIETSRRGTTFYTRFPISNPEH